MAEATVVKLKTAMQTKNEQMRKLTQTLSSMLAKMESLNAQITSIEPQTTPNPASVSFGGFAREITFSQPFDSFIDDLLNSEIAPTEISISLALHIQTFLQAS